MAKIVKVITADVAVENTSPAIVAKQYDSNSRFLNVTLLNEGQPIEIKQSSVVIINALREDKQSKGFTGEVNPDGSVLVPITQWMLQLDGIVNCDISIVDADTRKLTTTTFRIVVQAATNADENISEDTNYDLLVVLLSDVAKVQAEAEKQLEKIESLAITNHKSGNPVVINDSSVFPIQDIKIFGGNVILNPELYDKVKTENGVTATPNKDGSVTFSGTPTVSSGIVITYYLGDYTNKLMVGKTYYLNKAFESIATQCCYKVDGQMNCSVYKLKVESNMTDIRFYVQLKVSEYVDGMTLYPMVNIEDKPLPFESYKKILTKIDITGAQLLNPKFYKPTCTQNGVTITPNSDGSFTLTGKPTVSSGYLAFVSCGKNYEDVLIDGQTYYLGNGVAGEYKIGETQKILNYKFTFDKKRMSPFMIYMPIKVSEYVDGMTLYPMLNLGTEPLPFESYKERSVVLSEPITLVAGERLEKRNGIYGKVSGDTFTALPDCDSKALLAMTSFCPNTVFYSGFETEITYISDIKNFLENTFIEERVTEKTTWSSKKIVDELSPLFDVKGNIVQGQLVGNYPLSVQSYIEPVQLGTGDPSPENIREIKGIDKLNLSVLSKNLIDYKQIRYNGSNEPIEFIFNGFIIDGDTQGKRIVKLKCNLKKGISYVITCNYKVISGAASKLAVYLPEVQQYIHFNSPFTPNENVHEIGIYFDNKEVPSVIEITNLMLIQGTTKNAPYEPYIGNEYSVGFNENIYGGIYDWNKGELTQTWEEITFTDTTEWTVEPTDNENNKRFSFKLNGSYKSEAHNAIAYCSKLKIGSTGDTFVLNNCFTIIDGKLYVRFDAGMKTLDDLKKYMPFTVVYQTTNSKKIKLTAQQPYSIKDLNTVFTNVGETRVIGRENPLAIKEQIELLNKQNTQKIANTLALLPDEIQAAMIDNDTKNLIEGV